MGIIDRCYRIFDLGLTNFEDAALQDFTKFLRGRNLEIFSNKMKVLNRVSRFERDADTIRVPFSAPLVLAFKEFPKGI